MKNKKLSKSKRALKALNFDLFSNSTIGNIKPHLFGNLKPESLAPPAPATLHTKIKEGRTPFAEIPVIEEIKNVSISTYDESSPTTLKTKEALSSLPTVSELYLMFDRYNLLYYDGKLPRVTIEYSNRMTSAGSYQPSRMLIKISRKYHELFPDDLPDTLKHEMIHIIHFYHDANFKSEARRIGATTKAKSHPSLRRPPKYLYICEKCGLEYPRQKRLVMASCGDCSRGRKYDPRFKLRLKSSALRPN